MPSGTYSIRLFLRKKVRIMRILIVDDDLIGRKVLEKVLSPYGQCEVAADGLEAIKAFIMASAENHRYDLICLDIMMPMMDGHETLRRIRQLEEKDGVVDKNRAKVIMTTALADRKHIMQAAVDRCSGYLIKPIEKQSLLEKMKSLGLLADQAKTA